MKIVRVANSEFKEMHQRLNLAEFIFFSQGFFTYKERFNSGKLQRHLKYAKEKLGLRGSEVLLLDWEGEGLKTLMSERYNDVIDDFINVIVEIKKYYPDMRIGYYAIPFRDFWSTNYKWVQKNDRLHRLYKTVDFLAPSVYLLYKQGDIKLERQKAYVQINVREAQRIGSLYNLPVMPLISHNIKAVEDKYMSYEVWKQYISWVLECNVDDILWWHSDDNIDKVENYIHNGQIH